jgi:hypothetical protein
VPDLTISPTVNQLTVSPTVNQLSIIPGSVVIPTPALATQAQFIVADVSLAVSNQFYDCGSISLAAGKWLIIGEAIAYTNSGTSGFEMRLWNATAGAALAGTMIQNPRATAICSGTVAYIATFASAVGVRLQLACNGGTGTVKNQTNLGYFNATGLLAVQIG